MRWRSIEGIQYNTCYLWAQWTLSVWHCLQRLQSSQWRSTSPVLSREDMMGFCQKPSTARKSSTASSNMPASVIYCRHCFSQPHGPGLARLKSPLILLNQPLNQTRAFRLRKLFYFNSFANFKNKILSYRIRTLYGPYSGTSIKITG